MLGPDHSLIKNMISILINGDKAIHFGPRDEFVHHDLGDLGV